jgi:glycosyltransferase involved in cell wall biosynthesis
MALLCVGNWLVRKGIVDVLDAVADLPEELVTLHLVGDQGGDSAYRHQVLERLARPELAERVVDHGVVAPDAVAGLYAAADVFVLPSTSEPYGMVYGEAMSYGLPVVGWDAGNLPNLVTDRVEGLIEPSGDRQALSKALAELATDEDMRRRLGAAARARANGLPTWGDTARRFFAVCRDALADRP